MNMRILTGAPFTLTLPEALELLHMDEDYAEEVGAILSEVLAVASPKARIRE